MFSADVSCLQHRLCRILQNIGNTRNTRNGDQQRVQTPHTLSGNVGPSNWSSAATQKGQPSSASRMAAKKSDSMVISYLYYLFASFELCILNEKAAVLDQKRNLFPNLLGLPPGEPCLAGRKGCTSTGNRSLALQLDARLCFLALCCQIHRQQITVSLAKVAGESAVSSTLSLRRLSNCRMV